MAARTDQHGDDPRERARRWFERRTYHHTRYPPQRIAAEREVSVSVCVPAREEAGTIGPVVDTLASLRERRVIDQVVVVDAASSDGTARIAAAHGAEVHQEGDLMPSFGPTLGKGDAMWRALSVLSGDVVCFVDADSEGFGEHYVSGMIGPLVEDPTIELAKGCYRRPLKLDGASPQPEGGGRVTELTARPLLNHFYPELSGVRQPLAGEIAARRALLEQLPFSTGYAVEIALLIDAWRAVGLDAIAQVDLDVRQNRHQPLRDLGPMAHAVLRAVCDRLERDGRLEPTAAGPLLQPSAAGIDERALALVERPPMAAVRAAA